MIKIMSSRKKQIHSALFKVSIVAEVNVRAGINKDLERSRTS